jgi:hypothetical protein
VQPEGGRPEVAEAAARREGAAGHVEAVVMAGRRPKSMARATVTAALQRDLDEIRKVDEALATGTLAASAMSLARTMDADSTSAAGRSQCARALNEIMGRLRALSSAGDTGDQAAGPAGRSGDKLDDLAAARARRRAAASAS